MMNAKDVAKAFDEMINRPVEYKAKPVVFLSPEVIAELKEEYGDIWDMREPMPIEDLLNFEEE